MSQSKPMSNFMGRTHRDRHWIGEWIYPIGRLVVFGIVPVVHSDVSVVDRHTARLWFVQSASMGEHTVVIADINFAGADFVVRLFRDVLDCQPGYVGPEPKSSLDTFNNFLGCVPVDADRFDQLDLDRFGFFFFFAAAEPMTRGNSITQSQNSSMHRVMGCTLKLADRYRRRTEVQCALRR